MSANADYPGRKVPMAWPGTRGEPMTPETPDPSPVSPDPWKEFRREVVDKLSVASHCGPQGSGGRTHKEIVLRQCEDFLVEQAQELVDAARAADALRHQQETADLTRAVQGNALAVVKASAEGGSQIADLRAALSTAEATIASLTAQVEQQKQEIASWRQVLTMEAVEEIKSLRAERDALAAQVTALETELDETSAFIARATTGPDSPLNLAVDVEARAIRAEAERDAAQQKLADLAAGGNTAAKCVIAVAEDLIAACEARNAAQQQAGDMQLIANEQEQRAIKAEQERDAAQQENDILKREMQAARRDYAALSLEAQTLREALTDALDEYQRIANCSPATPWCDAPAYVNTDHYDGHPDARRQQIDKMRAALTPRPQEPGGHQP